MADHYEVLGISRDASPEEIKQAHRRRAREHHPDNGGDKERFQAVQSAYDTLKDPEKRAYYDRTGGEAPRARSETEEIAPIVVGAFDRAILEAMKPNGFTAPKGLGRTNITATMVKLLGEDRLRGQEAISSLDHSIAQYEEMQRRLGFTGAEHANILASSLTQRVRDAGEMRAKNAQTIMLVEKAIEHVKLYGWELDPEPKSPASSIYGSWLDDYVNQSINDVLRGNTFTRPIPVMAPSDRIQMRPMPARQVAYTKAAKHRRAKISNAGIYRRPHTCALDADGNQVPKPRGSWASFERQAAAIQGRI